MKKVTKKTTKEILKLQIEIVENVKKLAVTAFGLVAALAWNDAITALFTYIFPEKTSGLQAQFLYAILVTLIVVLVTYYLSKVADGFADRLEKITDNNPKKKKSG